MWTGAKEVLLLVRLPRAAESEGRKTGRGMNGFKEIFNFLLSTRYEFWRHIKGNQINVVL
jgi:hypothetical protein